MISMQLQALGRYQFDVGPRAVFVVECATGLVFKITVAAASKPISASGTSPASLAKSCIAGCGGKALR